AIDREGNVVARAEGAYSRGQPVAVCAQLDTVFPRDTDVAVARDGNRVVGPGICDNGRGLAAMLAVAAVMQHCGTSVASAVEFVATTGEGGAGGLRGARHYFASATPAAAPILDGAGDARLVNGALGSRRCRIEYRGPGG